MTDSTIQEALERFKESEDGSSFNRENAHDDVKFARLGEQWPDHIKETRQQENRPCLTINKLPPFIRQVVNDARQNKPSIAVHPVDNGADEDTAQVIGGIIRSIERGSGADVAYDTAIEHAVTSGFGFFRIGIDYAHDETFDMECRIERVPNPFMVHWDTNSTRFDSKDWDYAFLSDMLTTEQFEQRYPKADKVSFEGDSRDLTQYWLEGNKIRLSEYWLRSEERRNLMLIKGLNGVQAVREDSLPRMAEHFFTAGEIDLGGQIDDDELVAAFMQANALEVVRQREVIGHKVMRRIINANEVLEEDEWPGSTIPICPVWGAEVYDEGQRHFQSLIRDAKDPQRMFNFWRTASTELVALAPKAPFVAEEGAISNERMEDWQTANTRSHAVLFHNAGTARPQREAFAGVPAGAIQESLNASDDMKAIIGIYDSALGARSNETSGRAIMARQREADVSNFHFIDNLSRAIRAAGEILVEVIPHVYSARQTIRILGEDDREKVIALTEEAGGGEIGEDGKRTLYNLSVGKYDVTCSSGPSYQTQREETREFLIEIMRNIPGAAPMIGDLMADVMDFPNADALKKRLQMLLPPHIQQAEGIAQPPMPQQPGMPGPMNPGMPQGQPGQPPQQPPLMNGGGQPGL